MGEAIRDKPARVAVSPPTLIGDGFMRYERFALTLPQNNGAPLRQTRDLLRAAHVAAVIPVDPARDAIVLIRQFRLSAHLANGCGEMVEIVAGRVDPGETPAQAAARECVEEIGVARGD